MKIKCNSNFNFNLEEYDIDLNIELWIDSFKNLKNSNSDIKIFIALEPNEISHLNEKIINSQNEFDYVFCYDIELLKKVKNSILFEMGDRWVNENDYKKITKNFSVSTVCGFKEITNLHLERKKLFMRQKEIQMPKNFFLSKYGGPKVDYNNNILGDSKLPLFESMFHICIENVVKENFFTEKIIDCILTKSIPIYIGCKNIESYFNKNGLITANNINEIIEICNNLTEDDYYKKIKYIEENYEKCLKYINRKERVYNKIKEIINK